MIHRNSIYDNIDMKVIEKSNILAQRKQDNGRVLGRNNNSQLHVGRLTQGGKVLGGLKLSHKQIKRLIINRTN